MFSPFDIALDIVGEFLWFLPFTVLPLFFLGICTSIFRINKRKDFPYIWKMNLFVIASLSLALCLYNVWGFVPIQILLIGRPLVILFSLTWSLLIEFLGFFFGVFLFPRRAAKN